MADHIPVMLDEVMRFLAPAKKDIVLDATLGAGGYTDFLLNHYPEVEKIIGIDQDIDAIKLVKNKINSKKLICLNGNFSNYRRLLEENGINYSFNKVILDLGISSMQIDNAERGFSYKAEGPLDMRMDRIRNQLTAAQILNSFTENDIADIIYKYGEEPKSRFLAKSIVSKRKEKHFTKTSELLEIIKSSIHGSFERKMTAVKRVFQALRIKVNNELDILEDTLTAMLNDLPHLGRIVVLTFHSLEDRIVKQTFNKFTASENPFHIVKLNKKVVIATEDEVKINPRARSAKLRAIEKWNIT
ncbi:MAG: 16S rRNA (cytosine(1402)-N(4))-methyltransferase RsmH [Candidatus Margulisbacteria bacterium]|nr:16S rRNA (cytosine(1402)-N(4))-methyltransferase RsmH [Candidatus Margulisiibacteriota bacterium]